MELKFLENPTVQNAGLATAVGASWATIGNYLYQRDAIKNPARINDTYINAMTDIANRKTKSVMLNRIYEAAGKRLQENYNQINEIIKNGKVNNKMLANSALLGAAAGLSIYTAYKGIKSLFAKKSN